MAGPKGILRSVFGGAYKAAGEIPGFPGRGNLKQFGSNIQNPDVSYLGLGHPETAALQNAPGWGGVINRITGAARSISAPFQPTATPETDMAGGGGFGGGGGTAAVRSGEVDNLKNEIIARRDRANAIFDALTGAVSALAAAKRQEFETQFGEEQQRATDEFGEQSKTLSRTYRGRGLGDSSYRINALEGAGKAFQGALTQLGRQRTAGLGEIGATAAGQLASLNADRGSLGDLRLDEYGDDVGALRSLRNSIDERIRNAEVSGAQLQTPQGFAGRLNQIAPYGGTTNALKGALDSLIKSATPRAVKDTLVQAVIGNYDPDNAAFWQNYYEKEARKTETRV